MIVALLLAMDLGLLPRKALFARTRATLHAEIDEDVRLRAADATRFDERLSS